MVRAVLPRPSAKEEWLLTGYSDELPGVGTRLLPLEEEISDAEVLAAGFDMNGEAAVDDFDMDVT